MEPGTESQESRARNQEPGAKNQEPRIKNQEKHLRDRLSRKEVKLDSPSLLVSYQPAIDFLS